ncbi:DNA ligase 1 [Escovopsis weberi]|uniref:DNA ligase n=1 Tax=Escovopsis weberi TaxID=150374 RepID=A0A0M8MT37_ESCWE|nr:DNA ligase 1 [Escovopsis weberi]
MAPRQATLGRFFGAKPGTAQRQTTLSFAPRAGQEENADPEAAQPKKRGWPASPNKMSAEVADGEPKKRDRPKSPPKSPPKTSARDEDGDVEMEDEDVVPAAKRARRRRAKVEDEDGEESSGEAKSAAEEKQNNMTTKKTTTATTATTTTKEKEKKPASPKRKSRSPKAKKRDEDEMELDQETNKAVDEASSDGEESVGSASSGVEENPKVTAKARKAAQTVLVKKEQDAYPDWEPGKPVPYAALCATFSLIELTTKRLVIMDYCARFLRQVMRLTPGDLLPTMLLMINKLAPDYAGIELGIGESLIMKAIGETTGRSLPMIKADQKDIGDLGLVALKSRSTQPTMFKPVALTITGVHKGLMYIATMTGSGAQGRKVDGIKKLLSAADAYSKQKFDITTDKGGPSEAKFIVRFLEGKLRLGLAEKTALVSLAQAVVCHEAEAKGTVPSTADLEKGESILKTVYSELPSYDVIIPAMMEHGIMKLRESCKLRPGVPLKPMLAKPTKAITEVLDRFEGQNFTCEYKYDGERAQIHYVAGDSAQKLSESTASASRPVASGVASIFSRNSEDLSKKYPDILAKLHTWVKPGTKSFVLDCETVAWDTEAKKVLPFQQLMTRKRKDVKVEDVKIKVCVFAFDLLYLNGEAVVEKPLRERRAMLEDAFVPKEGEFAFATYMNGQELDEIQHFLDESVKASCEGLMVKMLDGAESGYEPSKRSRNWLKIKKDYLSGIGDSLDLVVLGAYYGKGKRTSVYGAFLLACYNPSADTYETVCNIGTGFSEQTLEDLHAQLSAIAIDRPKPFYSHSPGGQHQPDVWFEPRYVWEVKTADLTLSPRYKAGCKEGVDPAGDKGISLRFPRFIKIRDDKKPDEATSSRQVAEMYRKQESVTSSKGPAVDDEFEY